MVSAATDRRRGLHDDYRKKTATAVTAAAAVVARIMVDEIFRKIIENKDAARKLAASSYAVDFVASGAWRALLCCK